MPNVQLSAEELKIVFWVLAGAVEDGKRAINEGGKPATIPDWTLLNELFERLKKDHY